MIYIAFPSSSTPFSPFLFTPPNLSGKSGFGRFAPLWCILVLEATDRPQGRLAVVELVHAAVVDIHVPAVGIAGIALRGTPPIAAEAVIGEKSTRSAEAARQGRKAVIVCAVAINRTDKVPIARSLQLCPSSTTATNVVR